VAEGALCRDRRLDLVKIAGPGTRANIDEFTETTSAGIVEVGGAKKGKAIIILNPAEPPMIMRDTVFTLCSGADEATIEAAIEAMVAKVQRLCPRLPPQAEGAVRALRPTTR
jgi:acetaldehyde dehydrogenase